MARSMQWEPARYGAGTGKQRARWSAVIGPHLGCKLDELGIGGCGLWGAVQGVEGTSREAPARGHRGVGCFLRLGGGPPGEGLLGERPLPPLGGLHPHKPVSEIHPFRTTSYFLHATEIAFFSEIFCVKIQIDKTRTRSYHRATSRGPCL